MVKLSPLLLAALVKEPADVGFRAEMPRTVTAVVIGIQNQRRIGVAAGFVIEILAERGR